MIKIHYKKNENGSIVEFNAVGHAEFDEEGKDLVCSAVSSIIIGGLNAIKDINDFEIKINKGDVYLKAKTNISEFDKIVLNTIIIQLRTVEEEYKKYIQITEI